MNQSLIHLGYISRSQELMSDDQLDELLEQARSDNRSRSITGMLLYSDGSFFQVIEGLANDVEEIFKIISADSRHSNIRILFKEDIPNRNFHDWSMGFQRMSSAEVARITGINNVMQGQEPLSNYLETDSEAGKMLKNVITYFKQTA